MKNIMLLILVAFVFSNCCKRGGSEKTASLNFLMSCDTNLTIYINDVWIPFENKKCHPYDEITASFTSKYKNCFIGLDKKSLISVLGDPTNQSTEKCTYLLSQDCNKVEGGSKYYLTFQIDKPTGKVANLILSVTNIRQ